MKWYTKIGFALFLSSGISSLCFSMENIFYVLKNSSPKQMAAAEYALSSLTHHFKAIDILISQAYQVDANGIVWGTMDPNILAFATKNHMKVMVLVTNHNFSKTLAHQFLSRPTAQDEAIATILAGCKNQHFYGVQFDFEMVDITDKDALTVFYQKAAAVLHKNGLVVSFAVAPVVSDHAQPSDFLKKIYLNWEGAYDLKKLGEASDFLSVMAYNQHGEGTPPGPTASIQWVAAVIQYTLRFVPAEKISLGISDYSTYWFTGTDTSNSAETIRVQAVGLSYEQMVYLLHKYQATLAWNDEDQANDACFVHDWLYEYIFAEDAQSFAAKLQLVKKYHLRGISVFDLGTEDPHIWPLLHAL